MEKKRHDWKLMLIFLVPIVFFILFFKHSEQARGRNNDTPSITIPLKNTAEINVYIDKKNKDFKVQKIAKNDRIIYRVTGPSKKFRLFME